LVVRPEAEGGLLRVPPPPLPASEGDGGSSSGGGGSSRSSSGSSVGADEESSSFHLYVHVVHDNAAARALYEGKPSTGGGDGGGFEVESEETEALARGLARPRRLLLHKRLPTAAGGAAAANAGQL
jgi:hypothetical protein